jgi:hypothetical protein
MSESNKTSRIVPAFLASFLASFLAAALAMLALASGGCRTAASPPPPPRVPAPAAPAATLSPAPAAPEACREDAPLPPRLVRLAHSELVDHLAATLGETVVRGEGAPVFVLQGDHTHAAEERVINSVDFGSYRSAARMIARRYVRSLPGEAACLHREHLLTCVHGPLKTLLLRLYRDDLTTDEWLRLEQTYLRLVPEHGPAAALEAVLTSALHAPAVLYRVESGVAAANGARSLTRAEAVAFAGFAVLGHAPDAMDEAELLRFDGPDFQPYLARVARHWTRRPEFQDRVAGFMRNWLGVSHLRDKLVRPSLTGGGDGNGGDISGTLIDEFNWFVKAHLLGERGDFARLFTATETRYHRDLEGVYRGRFLPPHRIVWDERERKGALGLAAVLAAHASETASDPVQRGMLVRLRILCEPMPPPIPNADIGKVGITPQMQTRERFDALASAPACRGCHKVINPPGYLFESFDQYGRFRTLDNGRPVNDRGGIPPFFGQSAYAGASESWAGIVDLADWVSNAPAARLCFARDFANYFLAARVFDRPENCALGRLADRFVKSGQVADLVEDLVRAPLFRRRIGAGVGPESAAPE